MLGKALTDYVGVGSLRLYKVRFTKQTWPGEQLATKITVKKKYDENGEHRVDLDCEVVNGNGEAKVEWRGRRRAADPVAHRRALRPPGA